MRMLRLTVGVATKNRAKNEYVRGRLRITVSDRRSKKKNAGKEHIVRRDKIYVIKKVIQREVKGKAKKG